MKRSLLAIIAICIVPLMMTGCDDSLTINGQTYRTVKIGNQVWMAENMNVPTEHSWCYEDKPENCEKYGRLYTWDDAKTVCKDGWRLPSDDDWKTLSISVGGRETAGLKLKSIKGWETDAAKGWDSDVDNQNPNGEDSFGFSVLPAGSRYFVDGSFDNANHIAFFWSSTEYNRYDAYVWRFFFSSVNVDERHLDKPNAFSVRCVKGEQVSLEDSKDNQKSTENHQIASSSSNETETVTIGKQVWMKKNVNVKTPHSLCYNNDPANCDKYGRLYTWDEAMTVCTNGWRLPSYDDWATLYTIAGGRYVAGKMLKSMIGWKNGGVGIDSYGFSAKPAGIFISFKNFEDRYEDIGMYACFWSSTEYRSDVAYYGNLTYDSESADIRDMFKTSALSVRCVKDDE